MGEPVTAHDLTRRTHSYRNHEPADYREAAETSDLADVRMALRRMESGRFHSMLEATHKMFTALDRDERETFWRRNPDLMEWVSVYGLVEELNQFADDRPDDL